MLQMTEQMITEIKRMNASYKELKRLTKFEALRPGAQ